MAHRSFQTIILRVERRLKERCVTFFTKIACKNPQVRIRTIGAALFFLILIGVTSSSEAACMVPRFDVSITIATQKNTSCRIRYRSLGGVYSQDVIRKPRGIYGTANETSAAYRPPPDFVGQDYFEVRISYQRANSSSRLSTILKATVNISEATARPPNLKAERR